MFGFIEIEWWLYKSVYFFNSYFKGFIFSYFNIILLSLCFCLIIIFFIYIFKSFKKFPNYLLLIIVIMISFFVSEIIFRVAYSPKSNISFITTEAISENPVQESISCLKEMEQKTGKDLSNFPPDPQFCEFKDFKVEKPDNTFRIVTLGDSFTWGAGVPYREQGYPYQLEQMLNDNSKSLTYEVYNLGIGGFNTIQEYDLLERIGLQYNHDLLILQYHPNDIDPIPQIKPIENHYLLIAQDKEFVLLDQELIPTLFPSSLESNKLLLKHSYFLRFTSRRLSVIHEKFIERYPNSKEYNNDELWKELNHDALEKIIQLSKEKNTPLIIIFVSGANPNMCDKFQFAKSEIKSIALQNNIHFIDLCDYTKKYSSSEIKSKNDCDVCDHYNEKGYKIMAEALFENIQKLGFV